MTAMKPTVMVLEDEALILEEIREMLVFDGFDILSAKNTETFWDIAEHHRIDLFLLDLMLPDGNGLTIAKSIRQKSGVGIIILTGKSGETDRVVGLEIGADDYITKPFSPRELSARVASVLRRTKGATYPPSATDQAPGGNASEAIFAQWRLNTNSRELRSPAGELVHLTTAEFELLQTFIRSPNRVLERDYLLNSIHGREWEGYDRTIDGLVSRLRKKITDENAEAPLIKTVRSVGYLFACDVTYT